MTAYFITATGTEIGKTYIGGQLLTAARLRKRNVSATKPLMSGFFEDNLTASDSGRLLTAMDRDVTPAAVSEMCLHRFEAPIAPNIAMRRAGLDQNYQNIVDFTRRRIPTDEQEFHLVEGAGGLMSPVTDEKLHSDFIQDLNLPVILVTKGYLGAVSHTLTALSCLKTLGAEIAAVIVSQPTSEVEPPDHLKGEIMRWSDVPVYTMPFGANASGIIEALV